MAETEQVAVTADGEQGEAMPPSKSWFKLSLKQMIIVGAALAVVGGGAGGYFFFMKSPHDAKVAEPAAKPPVFMDLPEVLVNLQQAPGERTQYLKVKVVLEVKEQPLVDKIKPVMPRVMDTFQTYLRELRPADLNGSAGMFRLKEELTRRVNLAVAPNNVNAVLFKEIVVQ
jgi:flagellar FliL protein